MKCSGYGKVFFVPPGEGAVADLKNGEESGPVISDAALPFSGSLLLLFRQIVPLFTCTLALERALAAGADESEIIEISDRAFGGIPPLNTGLVSGALSLGVFSSTALLTTGPMRLFPLGVIDDGTVFFPLILTVLLTVGLHKIFPGEEYNGKVFSAFAKQLREKVRPAHDGLSVEWAGRKERLEKMEKGQARASRRAVEPGFCNSAINWYNPINIFRRGFQF